MGIYIFCVHRDIKCCSVLHNFIRRHDGKQYNKRRCRPSHSEYTRKTSASIIKLSHKYMGLFMRLFSVTWSFHTTTVESCNRNLICKYSIHSQLTTFVHFFRNFSPWPDWPRSCYCNPLGRSYTVLGIFPPLLLI